MWKVTGYIHPRGSDQYGPLPAKTWVGDGTRYKLKHKVSRPVHADCTADEYNEGKAKAYVRWLANRDGITIPALKQRVIWSGFYSATKTRNVKHYNGVRTQPAFMKRIEAVEWGHKEPVYNTRKDGRRGAYLYSNWICELRIDIPHWDWEPAEPAFEQLDWAQAA